MTAINGFPCVDYGDRALASYKIPGTEIALSMRREIAPVLVEYAYWFHTNIEDLIKGQCWGHAYRAVRGSTLPSFHSAGIALDFNSTKHPLGVAGTFTRSQEGAIRAKCRSLGLRWGGDYTRRRDEMHTEIILSRTQELELVNTLQTHPDAPAPTGGVSLTGAIASFKANGKNWHDVAPIQRGLATKKLYTGEVDALPGPATKSAYTAWQNRLGWHGPDADGIPGSKTLPALGKDCGFVVTG